MIKTIMVSIVSLSSLFAGISLINFYISDYSPLVKVIEQGGWGVRFVFGFSFLAAIFSTVKMLNFKKELEESNALLINKSHLYWKYLKEVTSGFSRELKIDKIKFYTYPSPGVGAFAIGRGVSGGHIAISEDSFHILTREELRAVISHEIAHLYYRDSLSVVFFYFLGDFIFGVLSKLLLLSFMSGPQESFGVASFAAAILIGGKVKNILFGLGDFIFLFISRENEKRADSFAVKLDPDNRVHLMSILRRFCSSESKVSLLRVLKNGTEEISNRMENLSTHPHVDNRIEHLSKSL